MKVFVLYKSIGPIAFFQYKEDVSLYIYQRGIDISDKIYTVKKKKFHSEVVEYDDFCSNHHGLILSNKEVRYIHDMKNLLKEQMKRYKKKHKEDKSKKKIRKELKAMSYDLKNLYTNCLYSFIHSPKDVDRYFEQVEILRMIQNGEI